jgi:cytochrome c biogenesis protein
MTASPAGLEIRHAPQRLRSLVELVSSMRFAIALLTLICIASVIGTVVQQHQPPVNYVNQFGPFWAQVFDRLGLYAVYSTPWFLVILAFLVISTSLCIARNAPKILVDLRTYKEHLRVNALSAFHHRAEGTLALAPEAALQHVSAFLAARGWRAKAELRDTGVMVAAKQGAANKLGYICAHSAIVLICLGGLSDGDLIVRAQMALQGKTPYTGSGLVREVAPEHRLGQGNPTFRGNLFVPEGARAGTALINLTNGVVLQDLPFDVELKRFIVEYYPTGMPKLFASDIVIHDADGKRWNATVKVNEPVVHQGVAIYQSSFEDGGSQVTLRGRPLTGKQPAFDVKGEIGGNASLSSNPADATAALQIEFTGLRVINVENMAEGNGTDVRKVDLVGSLSKHLGSAAGKEKNKQLQNVGPSVSYKLRDAAGQAREFNSYMQPIDLDGVPVFLAGVRDTPDQAFRYLRIPADADASADDWLRLRTGLNDPRARAEAAVRYARKASPEDKPQLAEQLQASVERTLALFAGDDREAGGKPATGLQALQQFVETRVPEQDRLRTSEVLIRLLNGSLFELLNLQRAQAGLPARQGDEALQRFMSQAVLSLADAYAYPAPVWFTLQVFKQRQASVFQVSRAPGKNLVYAGSFFLILGVFAMLYVRERRLWIWIEAVPGAAVAGVHLRMAYSSNRQTMDTDREFARLSSDLFGPTPNASTAA